MSYVPIYTQRLCSRCSHNNCVLNVANNQRKKTVLYVVDLVPTTARVSSFGAPIISLIFIFFYWFSKFSSFLFMWNYLIMLGLMPVQVIFVKREEEANACASY